ncbi:bacitracin ABC transporter ATP-binding protein [Bacillus cereus]|uniref:ABC transporter ATP-binding protein n=1 Tax=Bacillus sp. AFS023182 TaxID=2033492 RepID=UPI000BF95E4F|nr:ABC transporter ATP-binding protein [Bacillus sp. AFS023182]PFE03141.1 bacitracin ABC transporter ATP-binding protein [Bacillus sp. AFS023182]PGX92199.1 bacitracin ABC transporter ATP-binding protein [Bacillus cereus]
MCILNVQNLTKKIGRRTLVNRISFDAQKGEILGLLGPNGAGKTTTIKMIVGLISKTSGTVTINKKDTSKDFKEAMKDVGVIVENPDLYKFLSGYDNLLHFSRMTPNIPKERLDVVVSLVGLEKSIHNKVSTYSLGMKQRLALAIAFVHKPALLILDEPTNGLDPQGIRDLRFHLKQLATEEQVAIVVSSHLMAEMEMMCDRIAIIDKGNLVGIHDIKDITKEQIQAVRFEVDRTDLAIPLLQKLVIGEEIITSHNGITIKISKEHIPEICDTLAKNGVNVYGIKTMKTTLEDKFIEMTGDGVHND